MKNQNSKAAGHGRMPTRWKAALHELYDPFVERLYQLIERHAIAVTPCDHMYTRFLDDPEQLANATTTRRGAGGGDGSSDGGGSRAAPLRRREFSPRRQRTTPDD